MANRERKKKNDPQQYQADLLGNQLEQPQQPKRARRTKNGTVFIDGEPFAQQRLFSGEEMRVPFPKEPMNKIPDRLGTTGEPGTLFATPAPEPQHAQAALFQTSEEPAEVTANEPARNTQEDRPQAPLPVDPQVRELPEDLQDFVTYVPWHLLSTQQQAHGILPYVHTRFFVFYLDRFGYIPGIMVEGEGEGQKEPMSYGSTQRPYDITAAYEKIRHAIEVQGLRKQIEEVQPLPMVASEQTTPVPPEPQSYAETEHNPLLAILKEDEIYVDPNEVTIDEAEENSYPLLRRDVVTYKWWLEFSFDTREKPELYEALKAKGWKWGSYRQQWFHPSHFPTLPEGMLYANAGGAFYSEENADRLEARATRAREQSSQHYDRSNQLAEVIPFGQPMMPDHYSYRSDLSYRRKIWRQMDLFVEFYKKAEWLDNKAEGSRRLQGRKGSIPAMQNRLDRLQADIRSYRKGYEEAKAKEATVEYDYYRRHLTILASEILPLQAGIAERGGLPIDKLERPLQPGDYILIRGRGMYVAKVNQKTIKVLDPRVHYADDDMWELTYKRSDFQKMLATREELEARKKQGQQESAALS